MEKGKNSMSNLIEKGTQICYLKFILKKETMKQVNYILRVIVIILYIVNCSSVQDKVNDEAVKNISKQKQVPPKEDAYVSDVKDGKLATTDDGERVLLKSDLTWEPFEADEFKEGKFCFKDFKVLESSGPLSENEEKEIRNNYLGSALTIVKTKKTFKIALKGKDKTDDWEKNNLVLKAGKIALDDEAKNGGSASSELFFEGDTLVRKSTAFNVFFKVITRRTYIKCK